MAKVTFDELPDLLSQMKEDQQKHYQQFLEFQKTISQSLSPAPKQILTNEEVCQLLGISRTTLFNWEKAGHLKSYGLEKRRYYKYDEIVQNLIPLNK